MNSTSVSLKRLDFRNTLPTVLLVGLAVWFVGIHVNTWLTAQARFNKQLDAGLWDLQQQGEIKLLLSEEERRQCLAQLRSGDESARWIAAAKLASWRDQSCVDALVTTMQDDQGTRRTCVIAEALGKLRHSNGVPALVRAMHHPSNLDLRVCATHALANIGDERAVDPLIGKALNRNQPEDDCVSAILALGDLGSPSALPALRQIAEEDPDHRLRALASDSIRRIEMLQSTDPIAELTAALENPAVSVAEEWITKELGVRWDPRVAQALSSYLIRESPTTDNMIQTAALLIYHGAMNASTIQQFSKSDKRENRWLAEYVQSHPSHTMAGRVGQPPVLLMAHD